jgi:hypothetical protein
MLKCRSFFCFAGKKTYKLKLFVNSKFVNLNISLDSRFLAQFEAKPTLKALIYSQFEYHRKNNFPIVLPSNYQKAFF